MLKLSGWVFIVAGLFIGLTLLSYGYFQFYAPNMKEKEMIDAYVAALQIEADKLPATEQRIKNAEQRVQEAAEEWRAIAQSKSAGGNGFIDLNQNALDLTVSAPKYRDKVQRAVNSQVKVGGVVVVNGPSIPPPSNDPMTLLNTYFNFNALNYPVVLFEPGAVTVRGTFEQIARNVQAWSEMKDYFVVVDGLTISGTSPELTANYTIALLGYVPGPVTGPLAQPVVTGAGGAAGGGGNFGGGGGGGGAAAAAN
jgi:hypothetical protein